MMFELAVFDGKLADNCTAVIGTTTLARSLDASMRIGARKELVASRTKGI